MAGKSDQIARDFIQTNYKNLYIETAQTLWPTHFTLVMRRRVSPSGGEHRSSEEVLENQKFTSGVNFSCFILCPLSYHSNTYHCTLPCSKPSAASLQALKNLSKPTLLHAEQVWVSQPLLAERVSQILSLTHLLEEK